MPAIKSRKRSGALSEEEREALRADKLRRESEFLAVWNQDAARVGRVLRAHLVVEHFLTEYIAAANPNLGSLNDARLGFAQKVELLGVSNSVLVMLTPGLKRLNQVRNRLAHRLSVEVTSDDLNAFLAIPLVRAVQAVKTRRSKNPRHDPLKVLEEFADFTAAFLQLIAERPNQDASSEQAPDEASQETPSK